MAEKTLDETIKGIGASFSGKFLVERRSSEGIADERETVFDTAVIALELYKITKNPTFLHRCLPYFQESVMEVKEGYCRWSYNVPRSQSGLPPFPPDADSTALALLVLSLAEQEGVALQQRLDPERNKEQFRELLHPEGVRTWFGDFWLDECPDPVVTSAVALFYARAGFSDGIAEHLQKTMNKQIITLENIPEATTYYPFGRTYLAARAAEITAYNTDFLERESKAALDYFLERAAIRNSLQAAWTGTAAAERGIQRTAVQAREYLLSTRQKDGFWQWEPVHNQKTYWQRGHKIMTTVFAINAIQEIEKCSQ